jgi:sugar phosphate isomerase/epimerase
VDLSHLPLLRETPKECINTLKEHIIHAHMGNCVVKNPAFPGYGDLHPRFGFPGSENDVTEMVKFLRTLLDAGFLRIENPPVVSFEVKPFENEDPEVVIANAKRVLNEAWSRV